MRKKFYGRHSLPLITLLSCLSMPLYAQSGDPIGIVLAAKGQVQAVNGGVTRTLARRSQLFVGDTIVVGTDGAAQVRMSDDATISFTPNTEFSFEQYNFDGNPATPDSAVMSMVRGGFRTISGTVGDADEDVYRVETPMASIGIRGTTHGAAIVGNKLYTEVNTGGTTVENDQGSIDLGIGADYDYSETEQDQPPVGLLEQPVALVEIDTSARAVEEEESDGGDGGQDGGAGNGDGNNGGNGDGNANNGNGADGNANNGGNANAGGNGGNNANAGGNNANAGGNNAGAGPVVNPPPPPPPPAPSFNTIGGGTTNTLNSLTNVVNTPPLTNQTLTIPLFYSVEDNSQTNPITSTNLPLPSTDPGSNINPVINVREVVELVVAGETAAEKAARLAAEAKAKADADAKAKADADAKAKADADAKAKADADAKAKADADAKAKADADAKAKADADAKAKADADAKAKADADAKAKADADAKAKADADAKAKADADAKAKADADAKAKADADAKAKADADAKAKADADAKAKADADAKAKADAAANLPPPPPPPPPTLETQLTSSAYVGLVVSSGASGGGVGMGKALQGANNGAGIPVISHNGFDQSVNDSDMLVIPADVVISTGTSASSGPPTRQNVGDLDVDWGRWDNAQLDVKSTRSGNSANGITANDVEWAVFKPANMASLSGTYRYGNSSDVPISGIDETGANLRGGTIEFDVNLAGGANAISKGLLQIFDSSNATWRVTFNGDIKRVTVNGVVNAFASMTDITGTFDTTHSVTGAIAGGFASNGSTTQDLTPDFIAGFSLQSGGSFVQGITLLNNETCFSCTTTVLP